LSPGWNRIDPGGDAFCAHGDPYSYWVRPGTSGRLTVFFEGGGGCWDADTCRDTGEEFNGYYDSRVSEDDNPVTRGGVLDFDRKDNPFKDDTVVYIIRSFIFLSAQAMSTGVDSPTLTPTAT
jgi:hypothetical protein